MPKKEMTLEETMAQLQAWGAEKTRAMYIRNGAPENTFGVLMGQVRGLAKDLKRDHALAKELWATGNSEAQILATMLFDPKQLAEGEINEMAQPVAYPKVLAELAWNTVPATAFTSALRKRWLTSNSEAVQGAGWQLLVQEAIRGELNHSEMDAVLEAIRAGMKDAPIPRQETMNRCLVEIATRNPDLTQRCIDIAEEVGPVASTRQPKGCISNFAPVWIRYVLDQGKPGAMAR